MAFPAKYNGKCASCGEKIVKGSMINWSKASKKASHAFCPKAARTISKALYDARGTKAEAAKGVADIPADYDPNDEEWNLFVSEVRFDVLKEIEDAAAKVKREHDADVAEVVLKALRVDWRKAKDADDVSDLNDILDGVRELIAA